MNQNAQSAPAVLVVDDEPYILAMLGAGLPRFGLKVYAASDGTQAVELLRANAAEIRAALIDLHMPGMDGPATLEALRRVNPDLPCCLMGGDLVPDDTGHVAAGVAGVFSKPFVPSQVADTLRRLARTA